MPPPKRPEATLQRAADAVNEALRQGYKPLNVPTQKGEKAAVSIAAEALGINRTTFQNCVYEADKKGLIDWALYSGEMFETYKIPANDFVRRMSAKRGELGYAPVLPGYEVSKISTNTDTGAAWVQQKPEPGETFTVPDGHIIKGVSALVNPDGRQLATWIKTREGISVEDTIEAIKVAFDDLRMDYKPIRPPRDVSGDLLTVYPIADTHAGMFSWKKETGEEYDLKIAERLLIDSMTELIGNAPKSETAIVLNLGDFVHADNSNNQTARSGNPLDVDTRYAKVIQVAMRMLVTCVQMALQRHKTVIVRNLPGNHDAHTALALTAALDAYYHNEPRVKVDDDPGKFFFFQFGKVMIAATHGDMVKPEQMPGVAAARQPKMWGTSVFRHAMFGHIHHKSKRASEANGMIVETFQTLAPKDAWHAAGPYVSQRSICSITFHREKGEQTRQTINVTN